MESKPSYYMVIPASVWDSNLSTRTILLYGHISVLSNKKGYCFATNLYFEKVLNCSAKTIRKCMQELETGGFIKRKLIYKESSKEVELRKIYITNNIENEDEDE